MPIPDRWLMYSALGKCIPGTRFICFKVPLKDELCRNLEVHERFTPKMLIEQCPKLGLVIDLTNTKRYYSGETFKARGIGYKKLQCPGQMIPPMNILREFFKTVDAYLYNSPDKDKLIGVHCTHGINRTGYFICKYMCLRMGFTPKDAISAFENARGYKIERQPYIEDIEASKQIDVTINEEQNIPNSSDKHHLPPYYDNSGAERNRRNKPNAYEGNHHDFTSNSYPIPYHPYDNVSESPLAGSSYDTPPHYPRYTQTNMEYQSPLGDEYGYEPSNRYSSRGGYSQHRSNPYARPNNNFNENKGPFRKDAGRYGNKSWSRNENSRGHPKGYHSKR